MQHAAQVVATALGQLDVAFERSAIEAGRLGDEPGPLREGFGQIAAGQGELHTPREQWAGVVGILEERLLPFNRRREDHGRVRR